MSDRGGHGHLCSWEPSLPLNPGLPSSPVALSLRGLSEGVQSRSSSCTTVMPTRWSHLTAESAEAEEHSVQHLPGASRGQQLVLWGRAYLRLGRRWPGPQMSAHDPTPCTHTPEQAVPPPAPHLGVDPTVAEVMLRHS